MPTPVPAEEGLTATTPTPNDLEISTEVEGTSAQLALRGSLVTRTVERIDTYLFELQRHGIREVTLDLQGLTRLDSSGVAFLLRVRLRAAEEGVQVEMVAPPEHLRRTVARLGVAGRLPFSETHQGNGL